MPANTPAFGGELPELTDLIQQLVVAHGDGVAQSFQYAWIEPEPPPIPAEPTHPDGAAAEDEQPHRLLHRLAYLYFLCRRNSQQKAIIAQIAEQSNPHTTTPTNQPTAAHASCDGRIMAIVEAGEGEMGQTVFRDLFLSYTLPIGIVGCRWETLMTRAQHTRARLVAPQAVATAHTLAMRGAPAAWVALHSDEHDEPDFDVERICSLLCGLCMLLCSDSESIRTGPAFRGLVELPFLVSESPTTCACRIVQRGDAWFLLVPDASTPSGVAVHTYGIGVECMCRCVLALVSYCKI